jgi:hypothetical protein
MIDHIDRPLPNTFVIDSEGKPGSLKYMDKTHRHVSRLIVTLLTLSTICHSIAQERKLERGASPTNNPLKGLVPYARPAPDRFPHSMEFNYLGLAKLVVGPEQYNWKPLEELLDDIASRGNQAVVRIYMEYPGKKDGIPEHLVKDGLKVHSYLNTNTAPFPPTEVSTPDYENGNLRTMLERFILDYGAKYDGDPRIAYITAGLLGTWGEWHTYPRNELWASKVTQTIVMDAFERAFRVTPVLLRYPAGNNHYDKAPNAHRRLGYHDDSLCWATLKTGKAADNWFFVPALEAAGPQALSKWETSPIGGEIRPELWGKIFDDKLDHPQAQSFAQCAQELHLTWTMDTGMFQKKAPDSRMKNALREVSKLGYEFYVDHCQFPKIIKQDGELVIHVVNQGLAPMYHPWPIELVLVDAKGVVAKRWETKSHLMGILPNPEGKELREPLRVDGLASGTYQLLMGVVNPLKNGKPLIFANKDWGKTLPNLLTLGDLKVEQ